MHIIFTVTRDPAWSEPKVSLWSQQMDDSVTSSGDLDHGQVNMHLSLFHRAILFCASCSFKSCSWYFITWLSNIYIACLCFVSSVSSTDCERGFSEVKNIITPLRTQIELNKVSALIFISLVGSPLDQWDPEKYVKNGVLKKGQLITYLIHKENKTIRAHSTNQFWSYV